MTEIKKPDGFSGLETSAQREARLRRGREAEADSRSHALKRGDKLGQLPPGSKAGSAAAATRRKLLGLPNKE